MKKLKLFTDSSVNPINKIGFGAYLLCSDENSHECSLENLNHKIQTKMFENTSSTKLELQTFLWALGNIEDHVTHIEVYTDCQNMITLPLRREKLEKNEYRSKNGTLKNKHELYKDFFKLIDKYNIEFIKVKGHKKNSLKDHIDRVFNLVDKASRHQLRLFMEKKESKYSVKRFKTEDLIEIKKYVEDALIDSNEISFQVLNPDIKTSTYSGAVLDIHGKRVVYRSYKVWNDLANILKCKMLTPRFVHKHFVQITYKKLNEEISFHKTDDSTEKYGVDSEFSKINKNEEISFIHYYTQALKNVSYEKRLKILNLGVNDASEIDVLKKIDKNFKVREIIGIDYSQSAINSAKQKYKDYKNAEFYCADINNLEELNLGKFDLIITIGTLQSSNLEFNKTFMNIVQNHLDKDGAIILGFPNSRWIDGELIYGAMVKNYSFSEMSNLFKDVVFCKKYLQQKKFRVMITGKEYIFLSATSIAK